VQGLNIKNVNGIEGQVELLGYRAVVAMFLRWTLERRGEDGSGQPIWTLRAVLSFQKDSMLLNPALTRVIKIKMQDREYICEPLPDVVPYIDKNTEKYVVEGLILCPAQKPQ
jgi:hypothetical protein